MKIYYCPEENILLAYLGKSTMPGFYRYMVYEHPFLKVFAVNKDVKKHYIYIGVL